MGCLALNVCKCREGEEEMAGQYQGGHERVQDDGKHGTTESWAHKDIEAGYLNQYLYWPMIWLWQVVTCSGKRE